MKSYFVIFLILLINYTFAQQEMTCYMCQIGLQQIAASLQGNSDAMNSLAMEFVESCDTVPSESQELACKKIFAPEVFPQFVQNFIQDPTMQPKAICLNLGFC